MIALLSPDARNAHAQSWTYQESGVPVLLAGVSFTDDLTGTVVGQNGTILQTRDGGVTWTQVPSGSNASLNSIRYLNPGFGIAAGNGVYGQSPSVILRTLDGGVSWDVVYSADAVSLFYGVSIISQERIVVVGRRWDSSKSQWMALLLLSQDGGDSWTSRVNNIPSQLRDVCFAGPQVGVAVGDTILRSTDGGMSWIPLRNLAPDFFATKIFLPSDTGYVIGGFRVFQTTDRGLNWVEISDAVPPGYYSNGSFVNGSNGVLLSNSTVVRTTDAGASWSMMVPPVVGGNWKGVNSMVNGAITVVSDNGAIARTSDPRWPPAPMHLVWPDSGAINVRLSLIGSEQFAVQFRWLTYVGRPIFKYRFQIATDSLFTDIVRAESTQESGVTSMVISDLIPRTKYYWHMRPEHDGWLTVWSNTWGFTSEAPAQVTVRQIQEISGDSLRLAEFMQPYGFNYQISHYNGSQVLLTAVCIVPPEPLQLAGSSMIVSDTSGVNSPWHTIMVFPASQIDSLFSTVRSGDILSIGGVLGDSSGNTNLYCSLLRKIGSMPVDLHVSHASVSDFYRNDSIRFSTGEQYEGSLVQFRDLTVYSLKNSSEFGMVDRSGNKIDMKSASRWFTNDPLYRDPSSRYELPQLGVHVDSIRGILDGTDGYRIAPVSPGDLALASPGRTLIRGEVFKDCDRDGVRDASGPLLPNIQLSVVSKYFLRPVTTGSNGSYEVRDLDSGSYTVRIDLQPNWLLTFPGSGSYDFVLGPRDTVQGMDFGVYGPSGVLSGIVYADANGNGTLDSGEVGMQGWQV